jgi:hypothetical protein
LSLSAPISPTAQALSPTKPANDNGLNRNEHGPAPSAPTAPTAQSLSSTKPTNDNGLNLNDHGDLPPPSCVFRWVWMSFCAVVIVGESKGKSKDESNERREQQQERQNKDPTRTTPPPPSEQHQLPRGEPGGGRLFVQLLLSVSVRATVRAAERGPDENCNELTYSTQQKQRRRQYLF